MFSVSVSLDHWEAETHDRGRGYPGAFAEALRAIEIFKSAGLDTGVSAVLTKDMIRTGQAGRLLDYLGTLGIDEAWLSEAKPSSRPFWKEDGVCSEADRRALVELQDRSNRNGGPVVNYLGHFEGPENFGCNAGTKMIYIDAFGEVSPCVFTPTLLRQRSPAIGRGHLGRHAGAIPAVLDLFRQREFPAVFQI